MLERTPLSRDFETEMETNAVAKFVADYSTPVLIHRFDSGTTPDSLYDEAISKGYLPAVSMNAKVKIDPDTKYLEDNGISEKVDAVFIFSQKLLAAAGFAITVKDVIEFKTVRYAVTRAYPIGQIKDKNFFVGVLGLVSPEVAK